MMISSKKQLAIELSKLKKIEGINRGLEQYQTDPEIAADLLWNAYMLGDIEGSLAYDFGCGNGILGIGALSLGARSCTFIDKDKKAIEILKANMDANLEKVSSILEEDINSFVDKPIGNKEIKKIVIMNPPFGTIKEHADKEFLEKAFSIGDVIYSIHKSESKGFIEAFSRDKGFRLDRIWTYEFGIKKSHIMHKKDNYKVNIIAVRLEKQ